VTVACLVFAGATLAILWAGNLLVVQAERIATATGLSQGWIGFILVAFVTSLPELVATMTGGSINAPGIAVGNALGSNAFNLGILGLMGILAGKSLFKQISLSHGLSGTMAVLLTAVALGGIALGGGPAVGRVSLISVLILALYLGGVWIQFRAERVEEPGKRTPLGRAPLLAGTAALVIVVAGVALTSSAKTIAEVTGIAQSLIGSILVAMATSLPELASSLAALRLHAYDLLAGDIFGSNMFNIVTIFFADLTFGRPILGGLREDAWPLVLVGVLGIGLAGLALIALQVRSEGRLGRLDIASTSIFVVYLGGMAMMAALGFSL